jgi:hypothetical protein
MRAAVIYVMRHAGTSPRRRPLAPPARAALTAATALWFAGCLAGLWLAETQRRTSERVVADLIASSPRCGTGQGRRP